MAIRVEKGRAVCGVVGVEKGEVFLLRCLGIRGGLFVGLFGCERKGKDS